VGDSRPAERVTSVPGRNAPSAVTSQFGQQRTVVTVGYRASRNAAILEHMSWIVAFFTAWYAICYFLAAGCCAVLATWLWRRRSGAVAASKQIRYMTVLALACAGAFFLYATAGSVVFQHDWVNNVKAPAVSQ
jgi:hypothetical protein